jgi:multiple sugar transport system substrate-binding protein
MFGNHGEIPGLVENSDLNWDVAPLPRGRQAVNFAGGAGYTISKLASDKEAAWRFVRFLVGPKGQAVFAESGAITPARRSVREDNIFLRQQPYTSTVFVEQTELGRANLMFPGADAVSSALDRALAPVWTGERSAADAIAAVTPEIEALLPR